MIKKLYITTTIHEIKIVFCFLVCFDLSFKIGLVSALFSVLIQSSWSYICLTSRLRFIQSMKSREILWQQFLNLVFYGLLERSDFFSHMLFRTLRTLVHLSVGGQWIVPHLIPPAVLLVRSVQPPRKLIYCTVWHLERIRIE